MGSNVPILRWFVDIKMQSIVKLKEIQLLNRRSNIKPAYHWHYFI